MSRPRTIPEKVRRRQIVDAARAVLIAKGYQTARVDDVAEQAGVSKGTLYLYFKDKEDLVRGVLQDLMERLESRLRSIPPGRAIDRLRRIAEVELGFADENHDFLVQFAHSRPLLCGTAAGKALHDRYGRHLELVSAVLRAGVREGSLRKHDTALGGIFLVSLVRMFLMRKVYFGPSGPLRHSARDLMDLFLHGVGRPTRKASST
jgi:AcrR family transcriptional regulator